LSDCRSSDEWIVTFMNLLRRFRHLCLPLVGGWLVSGGIAQAESLQAAALKFPGLRVGAALNPDTLSGNEAVYANTVRFQFNLPSPENATKWGAFRPAQYSFDWADADVFARFARAGGQRVRGHTLVWHNSIPTWLTGGGFTPDQNRDLLFHHIDAVVGRYRSEIFCWDVVNEAFNNDGTLRNSFWYNQPGIGYATNGTRYIEEAFRRAALADPNAELLYNDYDAETLNEKSDSIYAMAQDFLNRGVPLHGIGFQMHRTDLNYDSLRSNFKRFNDLGLNLHITEMDIRILVTNGVATTTDLEEQAEIYWNIVGVALGQPRFKVLQTWGYTDKYSWIPGFFPGYGAALLFNENYQRKPAYWAVWNVMANQAERLAVLDYSGDDSTNVFSQAELSAGAGMQLQADATNDFMTLALEVPHAGEWDVKIGYRRSGASGQFQLAIAPEGSGSFVNVGAVVDAYGGAVGVGMTDLGTNTFAVGGNWQLRFTVAGKNVGASDYNLTIDYIRITPVNSITNTAPTISSVTDKSTPENTPVGPIAFTIGDAQTAPAALSLQAVSFNTNLLPTANIIFGGSGANRTVTLTPAANQSGVAAVLLLVSDGTNQTPETFMLNVSAVNSAPSVLATNLVTLPNNFVDVDLRPLVSDVETAGAAIRFEVSNPVGGNVTLLGDSHTARFTPALNYSGPASFSYIATDTAGDSAPDARWLLHYDFESLDTADDKSVNEHSASSRTGALVEFGTGLSAYETNVPAALGGLSARSLALTESGAGNGARLEVLLPSSTYNLRNADWTMSLWFRRATAANDDYLFHVGAGDGAAGDGDELDLALTPVGQLQLRHYNTANAQDVNLSSGVLPADEWHHAVVVFDRTGNNSGLLALYLNGVQVGANTAVSWALDQNSELIFGGVKKGNEARWLNGSLDDVALFSAVLSPAEISALAAGRSLAQLGGLSRTNTVSVMIQYSNQPPVLTALTNVQLIAGVPISVTPNAVDPDVPTQGLAFSLVNPPLGAVINSSNGLVTWRPTMAQIGSSNLFQVVVTEAGWSTNLTVAADAYVRDGSFTNTSFGADAILTVKQDPTAGFTRESYLRFALPAYPGAVASAQLRLFPGSANLPATHAVALVTNNTWNEATLTWNAKPASGAAVATWLPQANVPALIPVTAALTPDVETNGLLSLRIYALSATADGRVDYVAREGATLSAPRLTLVYTNASPLSATQSFWVNVIAPQQPVLSALAYAGGAFRMTVAGDGGPDYSVQVSTNLQAWQALFITNGAPGPFQFAFTNVSALPQQFYRIQLNP
jgi:GH35 family endo-1,4-beta-xylanase